jgi:NADH-quinone oxidoreductase subunit E
MSELEKNKLFSQVITEKLKLWESKYPSDKKSSVILPGLHVLQEENLGFLTNDLMDKLALYLGVPESSVYEVATFYSMYELSPIGRHKINICTNVSCILNGARTIISHIEKKLGIKMGATTEDNRITLKSVECQGACCGAPMLEVDKVFYEKLTIEKVEKIIDSLK